MSLTPKKGWQGRLSQSRCFAEYPEFPIPHIYPAIFGFSSDVSDRAHLRTCPVFTTGAFNLWLNWPAPEEREWFQPMDRYFITTGPLDSLDAEVHFKTENLSNLVRHLLLNSYTKERPILDLAPDEDTARYFFRCMAYAGFLLPQDTPNVLDYANRVALESAANVAEIYLQKIDHAFGSSAVRFARESILETISLG